MANLRLLIADDEPKVRNGMYTYLKLNAEWLDIYLAENGEEALNIIYKYKPDVMLLDIHMPIKDGFEVMTEAIAAKVCPKTIILSGYDEFKYAQKAIRLGAVDYILKPCRPDEIVKKIKEILAIREEIFSEEEFNPIVEAAKKYIAEHYDEEITLAKVAEKASVTSPYLSALFTKYEKCGFVDYLNNYRIERAKMYLSNYGIKTYQVAYKVGFKDEKYFSKQFKKVTGMSPSEYRKTYTRYSASLNTDT